MSEWPRHVCILLHGVETTPGEMTWAERLALVAPRAAVYPVEWNARSYGGLLLWRTSALATWLGSYRRGLVEREERYFKELRKIVGRDSRISVIAHSFGGYLTLALLMRGFVFHRIVLIAPAGDQHFDWQKYQDQFGLAWVYWSRQDEVIPWAYYGELGAVGPGVKHARVQSIETGMRHSEYFDQAHFNYWAPEWLSAVQS